MKIKIKGVEHDLVSEDALKVAQDAIDALEQEVREVQDIGSQTEQREIEANAKGKRKKKLEAINMPATDECAEEKDEMKPKQDAAAVIAEMQVKLDAATTEIEAIKQSVDARVYELTVTIGDAKLILGDSFDFKGKSAADIKRSACEKHLNKTFTDKSDEWVDARFDAIMETIDTESPKLFQDHAAASAQSEKTETEPLWKRKQKAINSKGD